MGLLYKVLKIDIFESCSWLGPLGVLIHQKKILTLGALIKEIPATKVSQNGPKWPFSQIKEIFFRATI